MHPEVVLFTSLSCYPFGLSLSSRGGEIGIVTTDIIGKGTVVGLWSFHGLIFLTVSSSIFLVDLLPSTHPFPFPSKESRVLIPLLPLVRVSTSLFETGFTKDTHPYVIEQMCTVFLISWKVLLRVRYLFLQLLISYIHHIIR